jgi:GWxTD domain-containing protein
MRFKKFCPWFLLWAGVVTAAACTSGPKIKLDPESEAFYSTARLIMTREEEKIFVRLPDAESRKEFITDFWDKRDPNPGTEENPYKLEFEGRVEYANKRFREGGPGYNTDRGRIYIFMGPPDKFEEYFTHGDLEVNGPILWWIYYDYQLGIEFVDQKNDGQYRIRRYEGNFFEALDQLKLGQWVLNRDVFKKRVVKFDLAYDQAKQEITVSIPADSLVFKENDEGKFQVDLEFIIYVYPDEGRTKETFRERKIFAASNAELLDLKDADFVFSRALPPGTNFVDVIIKGSGEDSAKIRKIFEVKVSS